MTRLRTCRLPIVFLFCVAAAIAAPAQNSFFTSLVSFDGRDGVAPHAGLAIRESSEKKPTLPALRFSKSTQWTAA